MTLIESPSGYLVLGIGRLDCFVFLSYDFFFRLQNRFGHKAKRGNFIINRMEEVIILI